MSKLLSALIVGVFAAATAVAADAPKSEVKPVDAKATTSVPATPATGSAEAPKAPVAKGAVSTPATTAAAPTDAPKAPAAKAVTTTPAAGAPAAAVSSDTPKADGGKIAETGKPVDKKTEAKKVHSSKHKEHGSESGMKEHKETSVKAETLAK